MVSQAVQFQVDWLKIGGAPLLHTAGRVALSVCPGRPQLGEGLPGDVARLGALRIGAVLSLVEDAERRAYGVSGLAEELAGAGIMHLEFPVVDGLPPRDLGETRTLCLRVLGLLGEGLNVLIHCIGGWGRSGTVAAALLCHEGHSARRAIELVRRARSPRCIETMAQEVFIHKYAQQQRAYRRRYLFLRRQALGRRLVGAPGERRCEPGDDLFVVDNAEQLMRALLHLNHLRSADEVVALSGEIPVEGAGVGALSVDRAYRINDSGLLPVPMSAL